MKSGPQYFAELRLLHVEAGYEVQAWLKRTFDLCRKALDRERGPTVRALEVKIADVADKLEVSFPGKGHPVMAGAMFLWAAVWCCGRGAQHEDVPRHPCRLWCPWRLGCELLAWGRMQGLTNTSHLFVTEKKNATRKAANIFGEGVSGHSPRRSGAMFYVRAGLPIQELAFL